MNFGLGIFFFSETVQRLAGHVELLTSHLQQSANCSFSLEREHAQLRAAHVAYLPGARVRCYYYSFRKKGPPFHQVLTHESSARIKRAVGGDLQTPRRATLFFIAALHCVETPVRKIDENHGTRAGAFRARPEIVNNFLIFYLFFAILLPLFHE